MLRPVNNAMMAMLFPVMGVMHRVKLNLLSIVVIVFSMPAKNVMMAIQIMEMVAMPPVNMRLY